MSDLALVSSSKGETLHEHLMGELDGVEPEKRDALVEQVHQIIRAFGVIFGKMLQQAASRPPSPGYEPYHVRRGTNPILARGMGAIAVRSGTRTAAEEPRRRAIFDAIRFLAKAKKPTPAVLRRVQTLVNGAAQTSVIETAFYEAKLHEGEFIGLLIDCREGRPVNFQRIGEIAATVATHLRIHRGPRISPASAAHQFILENSPAEARRPAWCPIKKKFTDPFTEATRREFGLRDFNPLPAYRRSKASKRQGGQLPPSHRRKRT
jgi:hypothetical protein